VGGIDAADLGVGEREHVGEAVEAEDARGAEERHAAADLDGLRARAFERLDRGGVVALGGQAPGTFVARVGAHDVVERARGVAKGVVP